MAKKRTTLPFFTKLMTRLTIKAQRSGIFNLMMHVTRAIKHSRFKRALAHMSRHCWPRPLSGVDYGSIHPSLGQMARFI